MALKNDLQALLATDAAKLTPETEAQAIAQADAENHLGYFDTRTHIAVPREPTEKMIRAGCTADVKARYGDMKECRPTPVEQVYTAMLVAYENEDGDPQDE